MMYTLVAAFFASVTWSFGQEVDMSGCRNHEPWPLVIDAVNNPVGDIYTPGFREGALPKRAICDYTIKARPGYVIKLTFKELDLIPTNRCERDKVYLMDGPSERSPDLGAYCGQEPPLFPIVSTNNSMHISLRKYSDDRQMRGFHARYEALLPSEICPRGQYKCRNNRCYAAEQKCNGKDDCFDGSDEENCNLPSPTYTCGISTIHPIESSDVGMDRVVGGIQARPHSWPWQADMQTELFYPNSHQCGATLINPQWIMTAAHCLGGYPFARNWRIHLGNHNRFKRDKYEQVRLVEKIVMWPGITGDEILQQNVDFKQDIALMKLNAPVEITDGVRPACLPPKGYVEEIGTKCVVTGWGETRGSGSSHALKQVDLFVLTDDQCAKSERENHICLDSRGARAGICHGDSGGPMACKINDKYHVLGIASFVTRTNMLTGLCAVGGLSVYNRVSNKIDWIQNMIQKFN